jgi:isocitrate dehydrogenase
MGVIGYEIAKRKKDGPNAEPIIMLRKKSENIYPGKQFQVKVSGSLTIQTALEQLLC